MKFNIKSILLCILCAGMAVFQSSCKKEVISPINQDVAFIKYYGHVANQSAADLIRTSDGGFLVVGSTNSYGTEGESDAFIIKTDSLGNEIWSNTLGRSPDDGDGNYESDYLRFDEEGRQVAELPDGSGYVVGVNRTYVVYATSSSPVGSRGITKIVLYKIDAASGEATLEVELRSETNGEIRGGEEHTEEINDIYIDNSSGITKYVVTGLTTDVSTKPANNNADNSLTDRSDMFTALLDEEFTIEWSLGNVAYGFQGEDRGVSVHRVATGYMVCGVMDQNVAPNITDPYEFYPSVVAVIYDVTTGTPTLPEYYGGEGFFFDLGQSVHNEEDGTITLIANVEPETGNNTQTGRLALLQIDESAVIIAPSSDDFGFTYYDFEGRNNAAPASGSTPYEAASINLLPNDEGFIIASTYSENRFEDKICILKVDASLGIAEGGWPYYFGYEDTDASFATQDEAGTILPITSSISGTSQEQLDGYAFVGTFGLRTNKMIGLVKLNAEGTLQPE